MSFETMKPFYTAFYGEGFAQSEVENVEPSFTEMVKIFSADLVNNFPTLADDDELRRNSIVSGLNAMRIIGAEHPNGYSKNPRFSREAILSASAVYNRKMLVEKTRERLDEFEAISDGRITELAELDQKDATIYSKFEMGFEHYMKAGMQPTEAKVEAYKSVINEYTHPEGKAYFTIAWKLPWELDIYEHPEVVKAMQDHPSLKGMSREGETRMKINGKKELPLDPVYT